MAQITLNNVGKTYDGNVKAVSDVNLEIGDGEFIVLVGPSGCGKSTLLRMVAGLETITEGEVRIGDKVVNELDPADRDIAMVFQNYALYPHMTVRGNLEYGLKNRRTPKDVIRQKVEDAAEMLEIAQFLERKPRQLSGGQRQRVAMGRAIVRDPAVFLFDEPLSNLDAKLRGQMRGEIKKLQRRLGVTSIFVTHDQLEAMTLADRLVVLNGGHIEQIGSPLEVYQNPASTFVASFIGSPAMNLVTAGIESGHAVINDSRLALPDLHQGRDRIVIGVRAEDLSPVDGPAANTLPLCIEYVEELGAQRLVHGHVGSERLVVTMPVDLPLSETLHLTPSHGGLHLFDAENGKRLSV